MKYRKKPIVIDATQWFKHGDHPAVEKDLRYVVDSRCGLIKTLEDSYDGAHFVEPGDWIITGVRGEHYAIEDSIFRETYDEVEDV